MAPDAVTGLVAVKRNHDAEYETSLPRSAFARPAKDWFVVGAGDYNGDSMDDLLVRQYSTGMLGYYICADQSQWVEMGRGVGMEWTVIA